MTAILKQRLIGSILLLLILAVIAVLLMNSVAKNTEPEPAQPAQQDIPFIPSIEIIKPVAEVVEPEPETMVKLDQDETTQHANTPESKASAKHDNDATEKQKLSERVNENIPRPAEVKEKQKDSAQYILQVGSFSKQSNAFAIKSKISALGHRAYMDKVTTSKGDIFRVRIGPQDKSSLLLISEQLQQHFNLKPQLRRHK